MQLAEILKVVKSIKAHRILHFDIGGTGRKVQCFMFGKKGDGVEGFYTKVMRGL